MHIVRSVFTCGARALLGLIGLLGLYWAFGRAYTRLEEYLSRQSGNS